MKGTHQRRALTNGLTCFHSVTDVHLRRISYWERWSGDCAVCVWVRKESVPDLERAIAGTDAHPTALPPGSLQA